MRTILFCILLFLSSTVYAQPNRKIQKAWIRTAVEDLSGTLQEPDTISTRYSFGKSKLNISFYPASNNYEQAWSTTGNKLTIGFDTYEIEELSDTSLTFSLAGFRRIKLLSQDYISSLEAHLDSIGLYNNKPLYRANQFIAPYYTGKAVYRDFIQKNVDGYNIKTASYFLATFIVTEEGKVENIKVVKSITEGFDSEIVKQLQKTSKDWKPAQFKGKSIQSELFYDIRYLKSASPYSSGSLHQ